MYASKEYDGKEITLFGNTYPVADTRIYGAEQDNYMASMLEGDYYVVVDSEETLEALFAEVEQGQGNCYRGVIFLMVTVMIIFYKQISEGYEDKQRYEIMKKVGMSNLEVRVSIRSQVRIVFFLPLVTAGDSYDCSISDDDKAASDPESDKQTAFCRMSACYVYRVCNHLLYCV